MNILRYPLDSISFRYFGTKLKALSMTTSVHYPYVCGYLVLHVNHSVSLKV